MNSLIREVSHSEISLPDGEAGTRTQSTDNPSELDAPSTQDRTFYDGHTYCGNPLGARIALEVLRVYEDEEIVKGTLERSQAIASLFSELGALSDAEAARFRRWEEGLRGRFQAVLATGPSDAAALSQLHGDVHVVPLVGFTARVIEDVLDQEDEGE